MRRSSDALGAIAVASAVVLLASAGVGPVLAQTGSSDDEVAIPEPGLYMVDGHDSGFWPYLNTEPTFATRSPINVVVIGNVTDVVEVLKERSDTSWNQTPLTTDAAEETYSTQEINFTGTSIRWGEARGSTRYAYLVDGDEGQWVRESAQLHDGTYFGFRNHIRLYEAPNASHAWVAMQTHSEHFDWFTLRHAVDGSQEAQRHLEADLMGEPYVTDVHRVFLGNDEASDADGWATLIQLAIVLPMMTLASTALSRLSRDWRDTLTSTDRRRLRAIGQRLTPRLGLLAGLTAGLLLGVRVAGLALERYATPALSMHGIAAILYPVIALVLPLAVYLVARGLEHAVTAGLTAALALGAAMVVDYAVIGIDVLPIDLVLHRIGVLVAVGLIAGGAARSAKPGGAKGVRLAGAGRWVLLLGSTLAGWI